MTQYIAFDTSKNATGYAYRVKGLWITGVFKPEDADALNSVIQEALHNGVQAAAIEDCYLGFNVRTFGALVAARTRIEDACKAARLPVELVAAQTWQNHFGISGKRVDRKIGASRIAGRMGLKAQHPKASKDECDAACLCDFAECRAKQEGRAKMKGKAV